MKHTDYLLHLGYQKRVLSLLVEIRDLMKSTARETDVDDGFVTIATEDDFNNLEGSLEAAEDLQLLVCIIFWPLDFKDYFSVQNL